MRLISHHSNPTIAGVRRQAAPAKLMPASHASHVIAATDLVDVHSASRASLSVLRQVQLCLGIDRDFTPSILRTSLAFVERDFAGGAVPGTAEGAREDVPGGRWVVQVAILAAGVRASAIVRLSAQEGEGERLEISDQRGAESARLKCLPTISAEVEMGHSLIIHCLPHQLPQIRLSQRSATPSVRTRYHRRATLDMHADMLAPAAFAYVAEVCRTRRMQTLG